MSRTSSSYVQFDSSGAKKLGISGRICSPRHSIIRCRRTADRFLTNGHEGNAMRTLRQIFTAAIKTVWTSGGGHFCHPLLSCAIAEIDMESCSLNVSSFRFTSGLSSIFCIDWMWGVRTAVTHFTCVSVSKPDVPRSIPVASKR